MCAITSWRAGLTGLLAWSLAAPAAAAPAPDETAPEPESEVSIEVDEPEPEPEWSPGPLPEAPAPAVDIEFWRAHIGTDIRLVLDDQTQFRGHLLAIEVGQLIAARHPDGTIVVIPAERVADVTARMPRRVEIPPMRHDRGTGLLAGGASLLALAGFMFIGTLYVGLDCSRNPVPDYYYYGDCSKNYQGFLIPGLLLTGAGLPMAILGKRRQRRFREQQVVAGIEPGRYGFGVRVGGRF